MRSTEWQGGYTNLVYLRARYYASQQGRFISRDIWPGDYNRPGSLNAWNYVEGNPALYTDPTGLIPCEEEQGAGICLLNNGGYLDMRHFRFGRDTARDLITVLLPATFGKPMGKLPPYSQPFMGFQWAWPTYYINIPAEGLLQATLARVALGIFLNAQMDYESTQGLDPWCYTRISDFRSNGSWRKLIGDFWADHHCSSFSNEDLPSDYLGFVAYSKPMTFYAVMSALGGGEQLDTLEPPVGYRPAGSEYWLEPFRCQLGDCGEHTPFNNQCTLKVLDEGTGRFNNRPWPSELQMTPTGYGIYWGRNVGDFPVPRVRTPIQPGRPQPR